MQIAISDPQTPGVDIKGWYEKHKEIIELCAKLEKALSKPYEQNESLLGRLVDIKKINEMDRKRKEMIDSFIGKPQIKEERKMKWSELSKFVVEQMIEIKKKHDQEQESEEETTKDHKESIYWQASYIKGMSYFKNSGPQVYDNQAQPYKSKNKKNKNKKDAKNQPNYNPNTTIKNRYSK